MIGRRSPSFQLRISFCKDTTGSSNVEDMLIKMLSSCTQQSKPIAFNIEEDSMFAILHHDQSLDMRAPTSQDWSQPTPPSLSVRQEDLFFLAPLPTTTAHEAAYSKREVARSFNARRLQASLGFSPDAKMISALNAGAFLNCDILPEDGTAILGASIAALKGRTVRARSFPALQSHRDSKSHRDFAEQHMHCDVMFVNKQPFLVSITHPLGIVLIACV